MTDTIQPSASSGLLAGAGIPYTVYRCPPFELVERLREINCTYKKVKSDQSDVTTVTRKEQIAHWRACTASAVSGEDTGWTACFGGEGSIAYPEACAAELAAAYLRVSRPIAWINVTARLGRERNLVEEIAPYSDPGQLKALFLTGLRWEGDSVRFDKVFDLFRQTYPDTDRILVGTGADPLALTRACDISVQRVLNVVESRFVNMV